MADTSRTFFSFLLVGALAFLAHPACAAGQVQTPYPEALPPVDEILQNFECDIGRSDCEVSGRRQIVWVQLHQDEAPPGTLEGLLDGLQRMAVEGPNEDVRQSAALRLAAFGAERGSNPHPVQGVLARLLVVYRQSPDRIVRSSVLDVLSQSVERDAAVKFLTVVAQQDSTNEDFRGSPEVAVRSLRRAGDAGRRALESLRTADLIKDAEALYYLDAVRE